MSKWSHQLLMSIIVVFGIQSVVFSLGQAVQIVGMNATQIQQLSEGVRKAIETAIGHVQKKLLAVRYNTINDTNNSSLLVGGMMNKTKRGRKAIIDGGGTMMRESLSAMHRHQQEKIIDQGQIEVDDDNDEEKKRIMSQAEIVCQRRLAVFRWTMTITVSYLLYKSVRRLVHALFYNRGVGGDATGLYLSTQQQQQQQQHLRNSSHNQYYDQYDG